MNMNIVTEFGPTRTGLSAKITIINVDTGQIVVSSRSMSEVGLGAYVYAFTDFQKGINYYILCDGGSTISGIERYNTDVIPASW